MQCVLDWHALILKACREMSQPRILIVEDEPAIADTLIYALRTEGMEPVVAASVGAAREQLARGRPFDLFVLDVGLPDGNGFEFCRELRATTQVPVLFLTARQSEIDRIVGLEIGGDDYVTKPFSPREVSARVRAILRRTKPSEATQVQVNPAPHPASVSCWEHNTERQRIRYQGVALGLTRNEYRLLRVLLSRPGRIFSREELLAAAWDEPEASMDRTVDAHIKMLRSKLRLAVPGCDPIETHRGVGYSLRDT